MPRSCTQCRRKKLKCSRETPCSNCMRSQHATCTYVAQSSSASASASTAASVVVGAGTGPPLPDTRTTTAAHVDELQKRIRRLEVQLAHARQGRVLGEEQEKEKEHQHPSQEASTTTTSRLGGSFHFHLDAPSTVISRGVTHKARLFGQSHWINTISLVR